VSLIERLRIRDAELQESWYYHESVVEAKDAEIARLLDHNEIIANDAGRLHADNEKLRKIASCVPVRVYIKAKEAAGYGVKIHPQAAVGDKP